MVARRPPRHRRDVCSIIFHTAVDDNYDDVRDVHLEHAGSVQKGKQIVAEALGVRRVGGRALRRVGALRGAVVGALLLRRHLRELERRDHILMTTVHAARRRCDLSCPRGASTASRALECRCDLD